MTDINGDGFLPTNLPNGFNSGHNFLLARERRDIYIGFASDSALNLKPVSSGRDVSENCFGSVLVWTVGVREIPARMDWDVPRTLKPGETLPLPASPVPLQNDGHFALDWGLVECNTQFK
jgi:hypothetical protein